MKTIFLVIAFVMLAFCSGLRSSRADMPAADELHLIRAKFYVSASGDDKNDGTTEKPFKTIERAQKAVRDLKLVPDPKGNWQYVLVLIRGNLTLDKTIVFGPEDSAPDHTTICYASESEKEAAALSGGREFKNFRVEHGLWKAAFPANRESMPSHNGLFFNDEFRIYGARDSSTQDQQLKPGEWKIKTQTGEFVYRPKEDEKLEQTTVVLPRVRGLVSINDANLKRTSFGHVRGLEFHRLEFKYAGWLTLDSVFEPRQTPGGPVPYTRFLQDPPALVIHNSSDIQFQNCVFRHFDNEGIVFERYCHDCYVKNCQFFHTTGHAIRIGNGFARQMSEEKWKVFENQLKAGAAHFDSEPQTVTRIQVWKSLFEHCGPRHAAINIYEASHCWIRKNVIRGDCESGIIIRGTNDERQTWSGYHRISENHIHQCRNTAIELYGSLPSTLIKLNRIHDIGPQDRASSRAKAGAKEFCGLYLRVVDGVTVENNTIYNAADKAISLKAKGKVVLKSNRLVAKTRNSILDHQEPHLGNVEKLNNQEIVNETPWQIPADDPAVDAGYSKYDEKPSVKNTK